MVRDYYGDVWDRLDEDERAVAGERQAYVARTAAPEVEIYTSDWFRSFLAYDPSVDWAQVRVPVLAVFAEKDAQVLAEQNASGLRAALETAGNEDFEITTIAEANHLFQRADTGAFAEYGQLEPEFIDGFLDTLVEWISVRAGVADPS